jgi:hypothetical protein
MKQATKDLKEYSSEHVKFDSAECVFSWAWYGSLSDPPVDLMRLSREHDDKRNRDK